MVENGVRCHAIEAGSGPPLVLLHGTAIDSAALTGSVLRHVVLSDGRLVADTLVGEVHEQLRAPEAERSFVDWLRGEPRLFALGTSYAESLGDLRVPGCGHWVPREAPKVFRSELLGFTRGCDRAEPHHRV